NSLPIGASESGTISVILPEFVETDFLLTLMVDDDGFGNGLVTETSEINNQFDAIITLLMIPPIQVLEDLLACDVGFDTATFNIYDHFYSLVDTDEDVSFFTSLSDLELNVNPIFIPEAFMNSVNPQTIYVRVPAVPCYESFQFDVLVENCPPYVPQGFSPNDDGANDWFNIQGLYDIFERHQLLIYNRYGTLIFEGNNAKPWDGKANR